MLVKNLLAGEGDWERIKEDLGWIVDTESGTVALPERKLQELCNRLDIPTAQLRMGRKDLKLLVGKLRSMHLAVPEAVAHLYHRQCAPSQTKFYRACLYIICSTVRSRNGGRWQIRQPPDPPT